MQIITGACPHDCPDTCSWQVAVDPATGRAMDIWGHPDHPITQGRLCGKVDRYLERVYHPDRLTTPLRRVGPKGAGRFIPITWEEALQEMAERLHEVIGRWGPEAVLPYSYAGTMGWLQGEGMASRFWNRLGASRLAHTICSEAGFEGYLYTIGAAEGLEPEAFAHARLILIWGSNTLTSNMHLWPFVQQARTQGAQVIVIDPARTRTARAADAWIPIRPGTDGALALAMMHVIIGEGLHDAEYVDAYTHGFEQLRARVAAWTPERAADITGIPPAQIRSLARTYAETQPAAIRINYGLQRHPGGGMAVRNITCLPALVGAWRHHGGGIQLSASGAFRHVNLDGLHRPDLLAGRAPRTLNMVRLGDALSLDPARIAQAHYAPRPVDRKPAPEEAGPPVKALVVYNSNPAAIAPDQGAVHAGLAREDLFTVVLEHFQTDTADFADILLPATTQLEHWDIQRVYGHYYVALNRPAIAPLGQARPNSEIFRNLAAAMGYTESCFQEDDVTILQEFVAAQTHPNFATVTWEALLERGFVRLNLPAPYLPFAQGGFPTPSGKCEFYSPRMAADGYDPLPTYAEPMADGRRQVAGGRRQVAVGQSTTQPINQSTNQLINQSTNQLINQSPNPPIPQSPPLLCISPPAHSFLNSTFVNLERFRQREGEPVLWMHPQDAAPRQITEGEMVEVRNERGCVQLRARITEDVMPGVVLAPGVWWAKLSPGGHNINQLVPQDETDMGGSPVFYSLAVDVVPLRVPLLT